MLSTFQMMWLIIVAADGSAVARRSSINSRPMLMVSRDLSMDRVSEKARRHHDGKFPMCSSQGS
jgi:hypothetical protein